MNGDFEIQLIQAEHGDAILVNYGRDPVRHLLIDGGPSSSIETLVNVLSDTRNGETLTLEAVIVTHYDFDHIGGIISLLEQKPDWLIINDIWFNGHGHLKPQDMLGPRHSDALSSLIVQNRLPWNKAFKGKSLCAPSIDAIELAGGLSIWPLSPTQKELTALSKQVAQGLRDNDKAEPRDRLGRQDIWPPPTHLSLLEKPYIPDKSTSNASSIAMLLCFAEKQILLSGDACAEVICEMLEHYWPGRKLKIDFLKMSHHGSHSNISNDLLRRIKCKRFGFTTNGKIHAHPDQIAIARVVASTHNPELIFNYANMLTNRWRHRPVSWPMYLTTYPCAGVPYVRVVL